MKYLLIGICAFIITASIGCAAPGHPAATAISATGSAADQATAYVKAADSAVKAAVPFSSAAGQALLGQATTNHASALVQLTDVKAALGQVQAAVNSLTAKIGSLTSQYNSVYHSFGYQAQLIVIRFLVLLAILASLHLVLLALQFFLPTPYGAIAGIAAKIVNPFGWSVAVAAFFEKRVLANSFKAATVAKN